MANPTEQKLPPAEQVPPGSLTAIVAVARNGVIGDGGDMLWQIKEDWARFKAVTMGGVLVFGRKTHESVGSLPGRERVIVTRDRNYDGGRFPVAHSVDETLAILGSRFAGKRWWNGGGGEVYELFWPVTTNLDICWVDRSPTGDTHFPDVSPTEWAETSRTPRDGYAFATYRRR